MSLCKQCRNRDQSLLCVCSKYFTFIREKKKAFVSRGLQPPVPEEAAGRKMVCDTLYGHPFVEVHSNRGPST